MKKIVAVFLCFLMILNAGFAQEAEDVQNETQLNPNSGLSVFTYGFDNPPVQIPSLNQPFGQRILPSWSTGQQGGLGLDRYAAEGEGTKTSTIVWTTIGVIGAVVLVVLILSGTVDFTTGKPRKMSSAETSAWKSFFGAFGR